MSFRNKKHNYPLYETTHFSDFREMTEQVAKNYPDKVAFKFKKDPRNKEAQSVTFSESRDFIRDLGTELHAIGIEGKKVALVGVASVEWFFSYVALMSSGAVTVPIDKELPAADIASIINTSAAEYIFFSASVYEKISEVKALCPSVTNLVSMGGECEGATSLVSMRESGAKRYADADDSYYTYEIDREGLASIVFTSGTTGKGKGVMLSLKNICSDMEQGMYNFRITERTLFALPPHHTFGSTVNFIGHFAQGCEIYISSGLRYILDELKYFKPTHLILVPLFVETFYKKIMATAEKSGQLDKLKKGIKISNILYKLGIDVRQKLFGKSVLASFGGELKMIICGGAALNQNIIDFFESIGIVILNGYGITECAPIIAVNHNYYKVDGSVGPVLTIDDIKINEPNEDGEGEIYVKGPNVMLGYFKDEEATKEAFDEEGYFKTGDYGKYRESDRVLFITGRKKNLIILSNGKNVYPEEIENELAATPGVLEIIVYEGKSRRGDMYNAIVAEIFPDYDFMKKNGIENVENYLQEYVNKYNKTAVPYKKIAILKVRTEEFPKNTLRKILRFKLDMSID